MRWRKADERQAVTRSSDGEALAQLARLIYSEMDVEPRHMHLAIELAREQLETLRQALVVRGLRRAARDSTAI